MLGIEVYEIYKYQATIPSSGELRRADKMSKPREASESGFYHVCGRGIDGRIIFENDADRFSFIMLLKTYSQELGISIHAWALMDNHYHLVTHAETLPELSEFMRRLQIAYVSRFNFAHGRHGGLFEGRFLSRPITSDGQFLQVVRYVHRNPVKAGIGSLKYYRWSSYHEYTGSAQKLIRCTQTELALEMAGGTQDFELFHEHAEDGAFLEPVFGPRRDRMTDSCALKRADELLGVGWRNRIANEGVETRDWAVLTLRAGGMPMRQIGRIVAISRDIVRRICANAPVPHAG